MGLSSTYIFNLDRLSLETLVEISPLGLGREFYLEVFGIGWEGLVNRFEILDCRITPTHSLSFSVLVCGGKLRLYSRGFNRRVSEMMAQNVFPNNF